MRASYGMIFLEVFSSRARSQRVARRCTRQGAYAEYAIVGAGEIALKPTSVDFVTAAAAPLVGLTTWQGLFEAARTLADVWR